MLKIFILGSMILTGLGYASVAQSPEGMQLENTKLHMTEKQLDTLMHTAWIEMNHPDSAFYKFQQLAQHCAAISYTKGIADALFYIGMVHFKSGSNFQKGIPYLRKSLSTYRTLKKQEPQWIIEWHNSIGVLFHKAGMADSAVYHYMQALNLAINAQNQTTVVMRVYNNLSSLLLELRDYKKVRFYARKAEKLGFFGGTNQRYPTYHNIAASYANEGQFDSALYYASKIDSLNIKLDSAYLEKWHMLLSLIYYHQKIEDSALLNAKRALAVSAGGDIIVNHLNNIATSYFLLKNYKETEKHLKRALREGTARQLLERDRPVILAIYTNFSNLYDSLKNYPKAYYYRTKAYVLSDSIHQEEKSKVIHEIETQFRTAEKDKVIAEKQVQLLEARQQARAQNTWLTAIGGGALLLSLTFITLFQRQRLKLQKARSGQQQQQIDKLQAVLDGEENERARIGRQLHDDVMVSFSIAKINLAALPNEYPAIKTSSVFENLSRQLNQTGVKIRQTAHNLMPDALLTEGLLFAISYFCNGINKSGDLQVRFQHYGTLPDLPIETQVNLYRIIQELVQNVVKHAHASEVLVQLYSREEAISITVDDDGTGIADPEKAEAGLGLKSIRSRLRVMGGEMDIRSVDPHGTAVHIEVKL